MLNIIIKHVLLCQSACFKLITDCSFRIVPSSKFHRILALGETCSTL